MIEKIPDAFVFMKVGSHAGESWEQIITRKNQEYKDAGQIFWGYGGSVCHPLTQVQPFARSHIEKNGSIYLVMQSIVSNADPDLLPAKEYSSDGINWEPIPNGVHVTGSRYAIVLDEITPTQVNLNPSEFEVGVGVSKGRSAEKYLKARIDKACLVKKAEEVEETNDELRESLIKVVSYAAKMKEPYAVMLR